MCADSVLGLTSPCRHQAQFTHSRALAVSWPGLCSEHRQLGEIALLLGNTQHRLAYADGAQSQHPSSFHSAKDRGVKSGSGSYAEVTSRDSPMDDIVNDIRRDRHALLLGDPQPSRALLHRAAEGQLQVSPRWGNLFCVSGGRGVKNGGHLWVTTKPC